MGKVVPKNQAEKCYLGFIAAFSGLEEYDKYHKYEQLVYDVFEEDSLWKRVKRFFDEIEESWEI